MSWESLKLFQDIVLSKGRIQGLLQEDISTSLGFSWQYLNHFFSCKGKFKSTYIALRLCSFLDIPDHCAYEGLGRNIPNGADIEATKAKDLEWDYKTKKPIPPKDRRPTGRRMAQARSAARKNLNLKRGQVMKGEIVFIYGNTQGCKRNLVRLDCNLGAPTRQRFRGYSGIVTGALIKFAKQHDLVLKDAAGNVVTKVQ